MFVLVHMNTFARTLKISGFLHVSLSLVTKMKEMQTSKKSAGVSYMEKGLHSVNIWVNCHC